MRSSTTALVLVTLSAINVVSSMLVAHRTRGDDVNSRENEEIARNCDDEYPCARETFSIYDEDNHDLQGRNEGHGTSPQDEPRLRIPGSGGGAILNQNPGEPIVEEGPHIPSQNQICAISIVEGNVTINVDNGNGDGGFATADGWGGYDFGHGGSPNDAGKGTNMMDEGEEGGESANAMGSTNETCPSQDKDVY